MNPDPGLRAIDLEGHSRIWSTKRQGAIKDTTDTNGSIWLSSSVCRRLTQAHFLGFCAQLVQRPFSGRHALPSDGLDQFLCLTDTSCDWFSLPSKTCGFSLLICMMTFAFAISVKRCRHLMPLVSTRTHNTHFFTLMGNFRQRALPVIHAVAAAMRSGFVER